jgi:predicted nucleic acid-binding protein
MDLAVGQLLESVVALPYEFVIPDVILAQELLDLAGYHAKALPEMGFQIGVLANIQTAFDLFTSHRREISLNDSFALALAMTRDAILMTGDRRLRRISQVKGIDVRGTLWVTAELARHQIMPPEALLAALLRIKGHRRTRLPTELDRQIEVLTRRA